VTVLAGLDATRRHLDEPVPGGVTVLFDQHEPTLRVERADRDRAGMIDDREILLETLRQSHALADHVEDLAFEELPRREHRDVGMASQRHAAALRRLAAGVRGGAARRSSR
jgi:hypothetical protein